jgi:hypothetical protein
MKTHSFQFVAAGLAALAMPAFALEAPADDAPPPAVAEQKDAKLPEIKLQAEAMPAPAAQTAFLGVVSGEVPEILADHLDLKPGEGVLVRSLVPGGPADKSGITANDVILRVAGQEIGSPEAISHQIATHQPGDTISIDLIHKGKPTKLDVTLGVRPAAIAALEPQQLDPRNLDGLPKELADRIRRAIEGNLGGMDLKLGDNGLQIAPAPQMEDALRDLKKRMEDAMGKGLLPPEAGDAQPQIQGAATVRMKDQQGSVEVKSKDGGKEVTIRDQQDNVTWSGPWDTAQDRASAPDDVRQRVQSLNLDTNFNGNGLRLQMQPNGQLGLPDN